MYDSRPDTEAHIKRVRVLLREARENLASRQLRHDASKLLPPEKDGFDEYTPKLRDLTYGSDEYKAALAGLKTALDHHYAHNSHHPEHYSNGVNGMSLFDVLEMLLDWKAATERHADGDIVKSLAINKDRFKIDDQLQAILTNTVKEMGWS